MNILYNTKLINSFLRDEINKLLKDSLNDTEFSITVSTEFWLLTFKGTMTVSYDHMVSPFTVHARMKYARHLAIKLLELIERTVAEHARIRTSYNEDVEQSVMQFIVDNNFADEE